MISGKRRPLRVEKSLQQTLGRHGRRATAKECLWLHREFWSGGITRLAGLDGKPMSPSITGGDPMPHELAHTLVAADSVRCGHPELAADCVREDARCPPSGLGCKPSDEGKRNWWQQAWSSRLVRLHAPHLMLSRELAPYSIAMALRSAQPTGTSSPRVVRASCTGSWEAALRRRSS